MMFTSCGLLDGVTLPTNSDTDETSLLIEGPDEPEESETSYETSATSTSQTTAAETVETTRITEETIESEETEETSEETEFIALTPEEESVFLAENSDTYYLTSGVGAWGAYLTVRPDGSFDYNYHDFDVGTYYICHAQGQFGNVIMLDEFTYGVEVTELTYEYDIDSEWVETDYDGAEINYHATDSYGVHQGDVLTFYHSGIATSELPYEYLTWYTMPRLIQEDQLPEVFALSGYYNASDDFAFIEDDYE